MHTYKEEMYNNFEKSFRENRFITNKNPRNPSFSSINPSFSSTLLDEIYRSIDDNNNGSDKNCEALKFYEDRVFKKQSDNQEMASLHRSCLIDKWMEKKVLSRKSQQYYHDNSDPMFFSSSSCTSDSSSGGFSSSDTDFFGISISKPSCLTCRTRPKPVRTTLRVSEKLGKENSTHDDSLIKSKSRAMKIYNNLKKVKQPISPGGKLASFLNSLFMTNGNTKKKNTTNSSTGCYIEDSCTERKTKSTTSCSSASSFYSTSRLTKSSFISKETSSNCSKRTVRFDPVSVIVDEDCRRYGHKSIYGESLGKFGSRTKKEELTLQAIVEKNRKMEEAAWITRDVSKGYAKENADDEDEDDDDEASDSSSDLFELDHLEFIGNNCNNIYCEELPVYETTHLDTNRAIARGRIC